MTDNLNTEHSTCTVYVNNMNDRIRPEVSRASLYSVISDSRVVPADQIEDIIVMKSLLRKGQAWVVLKDPSLVPRCVDLLNGKIQLHGKTLRAAPSRSLSDSTRISLGLGSRVRKPMVRKDKRNETSEPKSTTEAMDPFFKVSTPGRPVVGAENSFAAKPVVSLGLPSRTILFTNASEELIEYLGDHLPAYAGYIECRPVPSRRIVFAEFDSEPNCTRCINDVATSASVIGAKVAESGASASYAKV